MNKVHKNKVIVDDEKVTKKRNDRLIDLYDYLDSKGFSNHPEIIDVKENSIESKYIKEVKNEELIKGSELIKTISLLHSKTMKYKSVSKNKYTKIYNSILSNIEYLKEYYENKISSIEEEVFMSPSHYLFARNYSIVVASLKFSEDSLNKWYKNVENNTKERVCVVHNNLSFDHFIKGDKNYLISFDKYLVDTPVLDLYIFYKKEGFKLEFKNLISIYEEEFKLLDYEKDLLNTLITIPPKIIDVSDEYDNCNNIKNNIDYIYSSLSNVI